MAVIRVIDIETVSPEPSHDGICEIGFTDVVAERQDLFGAPTDWVVGSTEWFLIRPRHPFTPETSAVHHIIADDVADAPTWQEVFPHVFDAPVTAYAAHGAKFERAWISEDITKGLPWIDTYKPAVRLYPDAPSHSNSALRYFLRPEGLIRRYADPAHRAGPDSYVTAHHLRDFLNAGHSAQELIKWSNEPVLLPRCKIGKWRGDGKGTPWTDVESSYLTWLLDKDFDEDVKFTARYHLEQREIDQRLENERLEMNRQYRDNGLPETPPFRETPPLSAYENQELPL